jgi:hypothetical protein
MKTKIIIIIQEKKRKKLGKKGGIYNIYTRMDERVHTNDDDDNTQTRNNSKTRN